MDFHPIRYATGRWGFVGWRIPTVLAFCRKDGCPMTARDLAHATTANCPSLMGYKTRTWDTEAEAWEAAGPYI